MATSQSRIKVPELRLEAPRFENGKSLLIAGLCDHFTNATWDEIPAQWQRLGSYGEVPGIVGRVHYGLCFVMSDGVDYFSGVEVSDTATLPSEFICIKIPARRYAVFSHNGHVSTLHGTLDAIHRWLPASGLEAAQPLAGMPNFFERYGEGFDPRIGMGEIEVWMPLMS